MFVVSLLQSSRSILLTYLIFYLFIIAFLFFQKNGYIIIFVFLFLFYFFQ